MLTILALSAIPAVLAAGFDSLGLALVAAAGLIWAMGVYACTAAPVVPSRSGEPLNDRLAMALSTGAALLALAGIAVGLM
jgi:hypothetical protein